ncbi:MAG: hypothetical protein AAGI53_09505 [Planctomycetota bacterium]
MSALSDSRSLVGRRELLGVEDVGLSEEAEAALVAAFGHRDRDEVERVWRDGFFVSVAEMALSAEADAALSGAEGDQADSGTA